MSILHTRKITKQFDGLHAVDHLSLEFKEGMITGLIGPNGSGKSTFINLLTGMIRFDGGMVIVRNSVQLSTIKPHEISTYGMTRTFQDIRLFEQMKVLDNILVTLTERNVFSSLFERHTKYHLEKAEEVLKKVNLWDKRNELAKNLSYGQRKLLEIARVLAMDARIIFLDEPFAGLFPEIIKIIIDLILDLKQQGKTIILVEHNMDLIRRLSDYVYVLDSGKLLAEGKPNEVLTKKEVIEAYLGE